MKEPGNGVPRARASMIVGAILLATATVLGGCGDGNSISGPQGDSCGPGPYFNVLPVAPGDLASVAIFGGVDAPGHTLPTDHGGLFFPRAGVPLRAPGDIAVTSLRRVRYTGPDVPPGEEDYAIFFQVCKELTGWFGHVVSLASTFSPATVDYGDCRTYSVFWADIETCEAYDLDIKVRAGEELGTGDGVIDVGMRDQRVTNFYVSPWRFGGENHAVCMWEQWDAANQEFLFSELRDGIRPNIVPEGEPRCGTMAVDVAGTAQGVWAGPDVTEPVGGDDNRYMALVNYPYRPQVELALSIGPESLGGHISIVTRQTSGRVNLAFDQVTPDGLIYCYGPDIGPWAVGSWLLSLTSETAIRIEHIAHGPGASPCNDDPDTWSFGSGAMSMVR
ncbi:MAG: hypothetical protein PVH00_08490 [Gemmatimonadota bacterium]|jgi:hypothetical protein